ncbi:hypothetical protein GDO81_024810 [Engystomops pustulosus]|uniref:EEF1A lysine methyltransferase 2 n=1 Tax=Engystomops pustulosus TaxID=76066 RepID=A0AAV6Z7R5_ENGPU|nr:hypothetical protein GDO81_024810 [Engystomops pustulosus]
MFSSGHMIMTPRKVLALSPAHRMSEEEEEFSPSVLGTKEHWDAVYSRELKTFEDYGDEGEVWFGEGSVTRVVKWLNAQKLPLSSAVVDIGTGNGKLLVQLAKSGYSNLTGIDYCSGAIALAQSICDKEGVSQRVKLQVADFLGSFAPAEQYDVALDKGTFDAISLDPAGAKDKCLQYVQALRRVIRPDGIFIITSCNWTRDQLLQHFGNGKICDSSEKFFYTFFGS